MLKDTCTIDFNDTKINFVSKNIPPRLCFTVILWKYHDRSLHAWVKNDLALGFQNIVRLHNNNNYNNNKKKNMHISLMKWHVCISSLSGERAELILKLWCSCCLKMSCRHLFLSCDLLPHVTFSQTSLTVFWQGN